MQSQEDDGAECQSWSNRAFDNLYEPAVVVTEALRGADAVDGAREGMHALQQQYAATMSALREAAE